LVSVHVSKEICATYAAAVSSGATCQASTDCQITGCVADSYDSGGATIEGYACKLKSELSACSDIAAFDESTTQTTRTWGSKQGDKYCQGENYDPNGSGVDTDWTSTTLNNKVNTAACQAQCDARSDCVAITMVGGNPGDDCETSELCSCMICTSTDMQLGSMNGYETWLFTDTTTNVPGDTGFKSFEICDAFKAEQAVGTEAEACARAIAEATSYIVHFSLR